MMQRHLRVAFFCLYAFLLSMYIALLEIIRDVVIGRAYLYNTMDFSGWFKCCLGRTGNNLSRK